MGDNFFVYLERLELMIFFSGYPLVYLLIGTLAGTIWAKRVFKKDITTLLPYAYALVGLLYLGLQLKSLYPDYSFEHIRSSTAIPILKAWGLLSVFFLLPALSKKTFISLLHSLVFFFFLLQDLWLSFFQKSDGAVLKNDMNIYTYSLFIHFGSVVLVCIFYILLKALTKKNRNTRI